MKQNILVVDDDSALAEMLAIVLQAEGYHADVCPDGDGAVAAFEKIRPDLILLDLMLPGIDGIEVCRRIRAQSGVPIIMLTARSEIEDTVRGLGAGADDYIVKPFNKAELIARIRARLRDQHGAVRRRLRVDDVDIDVAGRVVERYGQKISLTPLEFDLLVTMAARPGEVVTRTELLRQVWGYRGTTDEPRLINVHIQRLRAKVEKDPDKPVVVQTVRGIGYKAGMPR